jgi:hypothetical protein
MQMAIDLSSAMLHQSGRLQMGQGCRQVALMKDLSDFMRPSSRR